MNKKEIFLPGELRSEKIFFFCSPTKKGFVDKLVLHNRKNMLTKVSPIIITVDKPERKYLLPEGP
jgi:hypothetical protein